MAESVDALVSNTSGAIRAGSTPAQGTKGHSEEGPFFVGIGRRAGLVDFSGTSEAIRAGSTPAQGTKGHSEEGPFFVGIGRRAGLVDFSGTSGAIRAGSTPAQGTKVGILDFENSHF